MHSAHPNEPINIAGHSYGGAGAMRLWNELEEAGIPVNWVGTFDPVSRLSREGRPAKSTAMWDNYYIGESDRVSGLFGDGGVFAGFNGDAVAKFGGPWGPQKGANNFAVTDWQQKERGESGHMGIFRPKAIEQE